VVAILGRLDIETVAKDMPDRLPSSRKCAKIFLQQRLTYFCMMKNVGHHSSLRRG
jgi:hypothetical protein